MIQRNQRRMILLIIFLILIIGTGHAAICPSDCTCLSPSSALKMGYKTYCGGKQIICDYDLAKNPLYCYQKPVTTTTTKPTYPTCLDGCLCSNAADAKVKGYTAYCGGQQTLCGYDANQNPLHCYEQPVTTTTAAQSCPEGCSCLNAADAKAKGYTSYCGGKQVFCGFDAPQNPRYCYMKPVTVTTTPIIQYVKCPADSACYSPKVATTLNLEKNLKVSGPCGFSESDQSEMACYQLPSLLITPATTITIPPLQHFYPCPRSWCSCIAPTEAAKWGSELCPGTTGACDMNGTAICPGACGYSEEYSEYKYCYIAIIPGVITPTMTIGRPGLTSAVGGVTTMPPLIAAVACTRGYSCLDESTIRQNNFSLYGGRSTVCGYSEIQGPLYCAHVPSDKTPPSPPPDPGPLGKIWSYIGSVVGGRSGTTPASPSTAYLEYCRVRYGLDSCDGYCVDLSTDPDHCGRCGNPCSSGQLCINRTCTYPYPTGDCGPLAPMVCGERCVDPMTDENNCGSCRYRCDPGEECCFGSCVDTETDFQHCGGCNRHCEAPMVCRSGGCRDSMTDERWCGPAGTVCDYPQICCGGSCVSWSTDESHCGRCGNECSGDDRCCYGECIDPASFSSDNYNCGSCESQCPMQETCYESRAPGSEGEWVCSRTWFEWCCNGTCVDLERDVDNCGSCGTECSWLAPCSSGWCWW